MTATLLYRIAAIIFVFFAVGHTYGFLSLRPPSPEGRAVYDSMNAVHFEVRGRNYSYGAFYRGFGLILHGSNAPIGVSVVASRPVGAFHSSRSGIHGLGVLLPAVTRRRAQLFVFWSAPDDAVFGRRAHSRLCGLACRPMKLLGRTLPVSRDLPGVWVLV